MKNPADNHIQPRPPIKAKLKVEKMPSFDVGKAQPQAGQIAVINVKKKKK